MLLLHRHLDIDLCCLNQEVRRSSYFLLCRTLFHNILHLASAISARDVDSMITWQCNELTIALTLSPSLQDFSTGLWRGVYSLRSEPRAVGSAWSSGWMVLLGFAYTDATHDVLHESRNLSYSWVGYLVMVGIRSKLQVPKTV